MLDKKKSNAISLWKYISIIPLASLFILVFACTQPGKDTAEKKVEMTKSKKSTQKYDEPPKPKGDYNQYEKILRVAMAKFIGIDYNANPVEFYFDFDVDSTGTLNNIVLSDTVWMNNQPSNEMKKVYAAKAYQFFANQKPWQPAKYNYKPVTVSRNMNVYFGDQETWESYNTGGAVIINNNNFPEICMRTNIPESNDDMIDYPVIFRDKHAQTFLESIKLPKGVKVTPKSGFMKIECDISTEGKIINSRITQSYDSTFDQATLIALNNTKGLDIPMKNGKPYTKHLKFELGFVIKSAGFDEYYKYIGCYVPGLPNFEGKKDAKKTIPVIIRN